MFGQQVAIGLEGVLRTTIRVVAIRNKAAADDTALSGR